MGCLQDIAMKNLTYELAPGVDVRDLTETEQFYIGDEVSGASLQRSVPNTQL